MRQRTAGTSSRVAVVTGASAGIGRAVARELAKHGYDVGLVARGEDGLRAACTEVEALGRRALVCVADVADDVQVENAAAAVERELGAIDLWVNNAMVSILARFADVSPDEFRRVTEVTYLGYVWVPRGVEKNACAKPRMRSAGGFRAGISCDPAAGSILRCQTRHPRLH